MISRRRTYRCRGCGVKFHVDTRLPEKDRLCGACLVWAQQEAVAERAWYQVEQSDERKEKT